MKDTLITQLTDTLTKKPEYGILSSMLPITMSTTDFLQLIGVMLGLFIAVITAILKVMELRDRIREKNGLSTRKTKRKKEVDDE